MTDLEKTAGELGEIAKDAKAVGVDAQDAWARFERIEKAIEGLAAEWQSLFGEAAKWLPPLPHRED